MKLAIEIYFIKISVFWPSEVSRTFSPAFAAGWDYYRRLRAGPASASQWRVSVRCGISVSTSHGLSCCNLCAIIPASGFTHQISASFVIDFKPMALCQCCLIVLEIRAEHQCSSKPEYFNSSPLIQSDQKIHCHRVSSKVSKCENIR